MLISILARHTLKSWHALWHVGTFIRAVAWHVGTQARWHVDHAGTQARWHVNHWHASKLTRRPRWHAGTHGTWSSKLPLTDRPNRPELLSRISLTSTKWRRRNAISIMAIFKTRYLFLGKNCNELDHIFSRLNDCLHFYIKCNM